MQVPQLLGQQPGIRMAIALIDIAGFASGQERIRLLRTFARPDARRINGRRMRPGGQRRKRRRRRAKIGWIKHRAVAANEQKRTKETKTGHASPMSCVTSVPFGQSWIAKRY